MKRTSCVAAASLAVGLIAGAWLAETPSPWQPWSEAAAQPAATIPVSAPRTAPLPDDLAPEEVRNIHVYETANRSVVNIDTTVVEVDRFWGLQRQAEGSGSGAVLDQQGHILTNFHVIDGAQESGEIEVTLASNKTYPANLVGGDKEHDIAILKINAPAGELYPIPLGKSDNLRVGQRVFAVGNPFGWDGTMTTGIVSSLNRNLPSRIPGRQMQSLIQTDAAMNPGNSGGPLLNSDAQMIGMCVAIASRTGQSSGIGFAIPINRIRAFLPDLINRGHVVRADIGISEVMETNAGLVIGRLNPEGPAAKAGLRGFRIVTRQQGPYSQVSVDRSQADRILAINGEPVTTGVQFRDKIWEHRPGEVVRLTIVRDGAEQDVQVTLGGD
jgi:S1-C subfamily serine protease